MGNIVWIASYPKSGNTWLRVLLANYLNNESQPLPLDRLEEFCVGDMNAQPYSECLGRDMSNCSLRQLKKYRTKVQRYMAGEVADTLLVKSHASYTFLDGAPAIAKDVTRGAIYMVRNPLDMVVSFADHYGLTIDQAIEASHFKGHIIGGNDETVPQYLGAWSRHVLSWLDSGDLYRIILRYEDMLADTRRAFGMVLQFLKLENEPERVNRALEFARFDSLQRQEAQSGFSEKSPHSGRFFRTGSKGGWRNDLSNSQVDKILSHHGDVMQKLGYLRKDGSIV